MSLKRAKVPMIPLLLALGGALAACGSDDPGNGDNGPGDGDGDGDGEAMTYFVADSVETSNRLSGIKVQFFKPEDGTLYPEEYTTNSNGEFTAVRPEGSGVFVTGNGPRSDGWNHPKSRAGEEALIRMSSAASATLVPATAGYTNNPDASPVAGSVYWRNAQGQDEPVGCVTIDEVEGATEDVRYFKDTLPTSLADRPAEMGTKPYDGVNEGPAGKFFIANTFAGEQTITARLGDKVVATRKIFIVPRKEGNQVDTTPPQNSNVHFAALWIEGDEYTENPTPQDCQ